MTPDPIDVASAASFPASDPPASTITTGAEVRPASPPLNDTAAVTKDPVCGMEIEKATAAGKSSFQGIEYFFCSDACREAFEANPSAYVARADARPHPAPDAM